MYFSLQLKMHTFSEVTVHNLPDEMILQVFSYLNLATLDGLISEVCLRWKNLAKDRDSRKFFSFSATLPDDCLSEREDDLISSITNSPHLDIVDISISMPSFAYLCSQAAENYIETENSFMKNIFLTLRQYCKRLTTVRIKTVKYPIDEPCTANWIALPQQRFLSIENEIYTYYNVNLRAEYVKNNKICVFLGRNLRSMVHWPFIQGTLLNDYKLSKLKMTSENVILFPLHATLSKSYHSLKILEFVEVALMSNDIIFICSEFPNLNILSLKSPSAKLEQLFSTLKRCNTLKKLHIDVQGPLNKENIEIFFKNTNFTNLTCILRIVQVLESLCIDEVVIEFAIPQKNGIVHVTFIRLSERINREYIIQRQRYHLSQQSLHPIDSL